MSPGSVQGSGSILFRLLDPSQTPPSVPFPVTRGDADPLEDLQPGAMRSGVHVVHVHVF